jgi:CRISPR-associated protein Cas1
MRRPYFVFSNGRLVRHQNTLYLHCYDGERTDNDAVSLQDAAVQAGCTLEDFEDSTVENPDFDDIEADIEGSAEGDELFADNGLGASALNGSAEIPLTVEELANLAASPSRAITAKRPIPVENIDSLYVFGEMDFNTKFFNFAARNHVPIHFFNYFGFYTGSFMPRGEVHSGSLLVQQVEHYRAKSKRLELARALVDGASFNLLKNLRYYGSASRGRDLSFFIDGIEAERAKLPQAPDVSTVMGLEGTMRALYYKAWPLILNATWAEFTKRVRRPPDNPVNALISFGNGLCYTLALSELYRTPLSPLISFLHEPGSRRFSLSLDLAEIFKPILCDRLIFKMINNGEIRPEHFEEKLNFCYLKEKGRREVLEAWDERLKKTIKHRNLGRNVSYRRLVRLECYALERHVLGMQEYQPFKIWW